MLHDHFILQGWKYGYALAKRPTSLFVRFINRIPVPLRDGQNTPDPSI